jgi:hypothetical protein
MESVVPREPTSAELTFLHRISLMRLIMRYCLALLFALLVAAPAAHAQGKGTQADEIGGAYLEQGRNADGSRYSGTASIEVDGEKYRFTWRIAGHTYRGVGTRTGDTITVEWGEGNRAQPYPVIYRIAAGGILLGTWDNGRASDTLTPRR